MDVKVIRKACNACSNSKVKCDGKTPACTRCRTKNLVCQYQAEMRRGRHPSSSSLLPSLSSSSLSTLNSPKGEDTSTISPSPHHHRTVVPSSTRRKFRIVFSLFKFHCDEVREHDWFTVKFNQLLAVFEPNSRPHLVLAYFLFTHKISTCLSAPLTSGTTLVLPRLVNLPRSMIAPIDNSQEKLYLGSVQTEFHTVHCNVQLCKQFGYVQDGSNFPFPTGGNFFPWGADVLSSICGDDSQVLSYVRDVAYIFNEQERQTGFSSFRKAYLLDRPITVLKADGSVLRCLISCKVAYNVSSGKSDATFDIFTNPQNDPFAYTAVAAGALKVLLPLPDLELGPWHSEFWLEELTKWSKKPETSSFRK